MRNITLRFLSSLFWLVSIVFFSGGLVAIWHTPTQMENGKILRDTTMNPAVEFVISYHSKTGRLPSYSEFENWKKNKGRDNEALFLILSGSAPTDWPFDEIKEDNFGIGVWHGEWNEYYSSAKDHYTSDDFGWLDGIKIMLLFWLVSVIFYALGNRLYNQTVLSN
jgi:hypothetical protein